MCLFIFYGQSHEILVISVGVLWLWFHQNLLLEFCKSMYKVKLDIAVAIKSMSSQYEMLLLESISIILRDPFF
jgi:hypothetical protein